MSIRIVQLGSPRVRGEGVRLGTVRRPPRGVPKSDFAKRDFYDVWLPDLAPSQELMEKGRAAATEKEWSGFVRGYRAEMKRSEHLLNTLAALSHSSSFSVGCYCENEERCHRSILRELLEERGARIAR